MEIDFKFLEKYNDLMEEYYELRSEYRNDEEQYEKFLSEVIVRFENFNIIIPEIHFVTAEKTYAHVCLDPEWEFPNVYIISSDREDGGRFSEIISEVHMEYYRNGLFYNEIAGWGTDELLALAVDEYQIPLVAKYSGGETEMINMRMLREAAR